jgi:hypothetical protein
MVAEASILLHMGWRLICQPGAATQRTTMLGAWPLFKGD